jgi:CheY-like chemotaxis protein
MIGFEQFAEELRDILLHLWDPDCTPSDLVYTVAGCSAAEGCGPLQSKIITCIEELEPASDLPAASRARRDFDILHWRFVAGLTQDETAERMHMSVRNVQRLQTEATHSLALRLWERWRSSHQADEPAAQARDWQSQADLELTSLKRSAPDAVTDVEKTIEEVLTLEGVAARQRGVSVERGYIQPGLTAAVHPSALRQTLITGIGRLAPHVASGQVTLYATLEDGDVKISMSGPVALRQPSDVPNIVDDIIVPPGASVGMRRNAERLFLWVKAPTVGQRTVVVVEDNPDMVLFYRRCTAGTAYRIVHIPTGEGLLETVAAVRPDVIVLDVMLPDTDGWQLLTELRQGPATRSIPVIVCSVVKEEGLALALGAALFLAKPIQPRQFATALNRVVLPAQAADRIAPERTAAA